jgi:hypothetical protein
MVVRYPNVVFAPDRLLVFCQHAGCTCRWGIMGAPHPLCPQDGVCTGLGECTGTSGLCCCTRSCHPSLLPACLQYSSAATAGGRACVCMSTQSSTRWPGCKHWAAHTALITCGASACDWSPRCTGMQQQRQLKCMFVSCRCMQGPDAACWCQQPRRRALPGCRL